MPRNKAQFEKELDEVMFLKTHWEKEWNSDNDITAGKYYYTKYKKEINESIIDFKSGPAALDKDAILDWAKNNIEALVYFEKENRAKYSENKDVEKAEKETKEIRNALNDWLSLYAENKDILLNEDGTERDLSHAAPGSPEKAVKEKYDLVMDKFVTMAANKANEQDRKEFGKFADALKDAAKSTLHDSSEYKQIMTLLNKFKDGVDFSNGPDAEDWKMLDVNQKQALSMYKLKDAIDNYIDHKADDGVKTKDFMKLAVVEELNQFVSERLQKLKYTAFEFNGESYNYAPHITYAKEVKSLNEMYARHNLPILSNTDVSERIEKNLGEDLKNSKVGKELQNYSSCMDRIMKAKQDKLLNKNENCTCDDLEKGIESMRKQRNDIVEKTIAAYKTAEMKDKLTQRVNEIQQYSKIAGPEDYESESRSVFTKIADTMKALKQLPKDSTKDLRDNLSVAFADVVFKLQEPNKHPEGIWGEPEFKDIKKDAKEFFDRGVSLKAAKLQKESEANKAVKKDVKARGV